MLYISQCCVLEEKPCVNYLLNRLNGRSFDHFFESKTLVMRKWVILFLKCVTLGYSVLSTLSLYAPPWFPVFADTI